MLQSLCPWNCIVTADDQAALVGYNLSMLVESADQLIVTGTHCTTVRVRAIVVDSLSALTLVI